MGDRQTLGLVDQVDSNNNNTGESKMIKEKVINNPNYQENKSDIRVAKLK